MTEWSREQRYRRIEDVNKDELEALKHRIEQSSYRQHFHIQPETGLLNDPNGLMFYNGTYYVSHQWFPLGAVHGLKYWFNYTSKDLVTFEPHIPFALFMLFQMMFCTIAVSILSGSIAERMRFIPFTIFIFIWVIMIYSPVAHWVWGGGWIQQLDALDYAGGTVVHITSGVSGLVLAIMIGHGKKVEKLQPNNLLITLIGGIFVWIGWYGFNTGSAFTLNDIAVISFVNTIIAASGGAFSWLILEYFSNKKLSLLGLLSGVLSGLVTITPAAGFVNYLSAYIISMIGGIACYFVVNSIKEKLRYNDTLDAFGIHGVGGVIGAILTGVFQSHKVNKDILDGLIYTGHLHTIWIQCIAVIVVVLYSIIITFIIGKTLSIFMSLATTVEEDKTGLDQLVHGEKAYFYGELNKLHKRY